MDHPAWQLQDLPSNPSGLLRVVADPDEGAAAALKDFLHSELGRRYCHMKSNIGIIDLR